MSKEEQKHLDQMIENEIDEKILNRKEREELEEALMDEVNDIDEETIGTERCDECKQSFPSEKLCSVENDWRRVCVSCYQWLLRTGAI